ncbi:MAG: RNA polymerase sigma factor [Acidobacteria bacterium]|nr:RNA polymerase sigma factor [Acidobacteriota bacterium]
MEVVLPVPEVLAEAPPALEADWEVSLVRRCQLGDQEAFRLLVERYQRKVFSVVHALIRRRADVEDIAQQVFTKIYFGLQRFDARSALLTWIYKITVNECYDYLRKQRSDRMLCLAEMSEEQARELHNTPQREISPEQKTEIAQLVSLLLGKVSPEERLLLLMKEMEGYSIQELAHLFRWNENTVKVRLFRARKKLVQVAQKQLRQRK